MQVGISSDQAKVQVRKEQKGQTNITKSAFDWKAVLLDSAQ